MQLHIITPEKTLFSAEAAMVVVPGTEGDFGVLPGHAPFISSLKPGVITIDTEGGKQQKIAVMGGFAEVVPERCTVLAETAWIAPQPTFKRPSKKRVSELEAAPMTPKATPRKSCQVRRSNRAPEAGNRPSWLVSPASVCRLTASALAFITAA